MYSLKDKVIIVTGGSGLLGNAFIKQIVSENGIAINADINLPTDIAQGNIECDITNQNSLNNMLNIVLDKYGKIDGLVNNAYPRTGDWGLDFEEIPIDSWRENLDMQLNSCFSLCQKTLRIMKDQKFGSIVNIASIYGVVGPDFSVYDGTEMTMPAAYSAIKGAQINFTRYIASYYGKYNININCVSPGGIFNEQNPTFVENYNKKVPMRRMGTPEDISPTVAFLLSDNAKYITGQNVIIDGGWTAI
ncbi:oxidoreductase [Mucilaginibacter sp. OK098]|uniref:oxidoreductase n=1 Tax=Mucilaginibacter sp. OK098 TaxID=1855297 RepID=UPI0009350439|nr:oxidoreductase [Mucilaginibacter sp. OK098]